MRYERTRRLTQDPGSTGRNWPAGNDAVSEYQRARREGGEALAENPAS